MVRVAAVGDNQLLDFGVVLRRRSFGTIRDRTTPVGWFPHFIYRMDHFMPKQLGVKRSVMDVFQKNIHGTVQFEASNLKWLADFLGPERFMWSTDYPHFDCPFPHSRRFVDEFFKDFSPEAAAMMLEGAPARLFGFDTARLPNPRIMAAG